RDPRQDRVPPGAPLGGVRRAAVRRGITGGAPARVRPRGATGGARPALARGRLLLALARPVVVRARPAAAAPSALRAAPERGRHREALARALAHGRRVDGEGLEHLVVVEEDRRP